MGFTDFLSGGAGENIGIGDIYGPNAGMWMNLSGQIGDLGRRTYGPIDRLADVDPWQRQALNQQYNYSQGLAPALSDAYMQQGRMGMSGLGGMQDMLQRGMAGDPSLMFNQGVIDTTMQNLMPGLQGSYDEMMRDPTRQTMENIIPGIQDDAFLTGNTASAGAATNTSLAQRALADRGADTAAQLYMNASNQAADNAMRAGAGSLATLMQGGSTLAQQGLGGFGNAANLSKDAFSQLGQAGAGRRGFEQERINEQVNRYEYNRDQPFMDLATKLNMLTQQQMPAYAVQNNAARGGSAFGGALDLAMSGLGLASGMGWNPFGNPSGAANAPMPQPQLTMPQPGNAGGWYTTVPGL